MDKFWNSALKHRSSAAIAGVLIFFIYPIILQSEALTSVSAELKIVLFLVLAVFTFLISYKIISSETNEKDNQPSAEKETQTIKIIDSTIHGGLAGGNQTNNYYGDSAQSGGKINKSYVGDDRSGEKSRDRDRHE